MKKWNNYALIVCIILLLAICVVSIFGTSQNSDTEDEQLDDPTAIYPNK